MSTKYKVHNPEGFYFMTLTIVGWIDLFSRQVYRDILLESLRYCQQHKGLLLYAYVVMTNHVHLIAAVQEGHDLVETIRSLKKHTAKQMLEAIEKEPESRREWLLYLLGYFGKQVRQAHQVWQHDNHPIELWSEAVIRQKLDYLHWNPVGAGFVEAPEHWVYSSASNYLYGKGMLEVIVPA